MKNALIIITLLFTTFISAQCISGDCQNGFGSMRYTEGTYEGYFTNGKIDKLGLMNFTNGNFYFGEINNGSFGPFGNFKWATGQSHFGLWDINLQNGQGLYTDEKGIITAGQWLKGNSAKIESQLAPSNNPKGCVGNCIDGYGRIYLADSTMIQAVFKNGIAEFGHIKTKSYVFDGIIKNNLPNGYGQMGYTNGDHYFGYFTNGKRHGEGVFSPKNKTRTAGLWKNDELLELNEVEFCNEFLKLTRLHIFQVTTLPYEKNDLFTSEKHLKNKFLNVFPLTLKRAPFNDDYDLTITFPKSILNTPIVSKQKLNEVLTKCNSIIKLEDFYFSFEDISISIHEENSEITIVIRYPSEK